MPDILSLNQLIADRVRKHPDLQILAIPDKNFNYTTYTTAELDAAASLLANYLRDTGALPGRAKGDATSRLTVGLLGVSNIDYVVTEMALYRMGYCVLFLSPNNSPPAIAHLLTITNASHIIVQDALLPSATTALTHLAVPSSVSIIHQPPSDVFGPDARVAHPDRTHWDPPLTPDVEFLLPVTIIHSSGSTGFPKPIIATNKAAVGNCIMNFNLTSLTTLPLYHGHGHSNLYRAWYAATPLYLFPTGSIPLTSANIIKLLSQAQDIQALYGVPFALKLLAETPEGLQVLKRLKLVMFGGSACPDELGDFLVSQGVPLVGHYGLSEMGQLMTSFRDFDTDKEWNWVRAKGPYIHTGVHEYMRFVPCDSDTYELYILDGWYTKVMSNQPDGSYATKDLFIKHPTIPDAYKYIGRVDDTLIMVNGEKTNPVPIELTLRSSPHIVDAIVFGARRTQIGALILPSEAAQHFSQDEFIRSITSTVALANAEAPSHSQLFTEALVFLPYGTQIPRADKGSILRPKVYREFEKEIERVYKRLEGEVGSEGKIRVEKEGEARVVVRDVIGRMIERPIDGLEDDTDLFDFGLDSLQSGRIRNAIQREIDLGGKTLSINAVFEHPSITKCVGIQLIVTATHASSLARLAKLVASLSTGKETDDLQTSPQKLMLELVDRYSQFTYPLEVHAKWVNDRTTSTSGKVVVLTGATGSLGSYILDELLADEDVETVYCLCRANDDTHAADRLAQSMKSRRLLTRLSVANANAKKRIVALAADLPAVRLGLDGERYRQIASRVTVIIHNAWAVNFNLGISSFETHIRGAVNLMHLALSSPRSQPAKFFFASSVSAVANWPGPGLVPEAVMDNPAVAQEMGYAQSKWVMEKLCQIAARTTPMHTAVLRIGQMVGDTTNGIWNESEGISLIIKCADTIGILPRLDDHVSWLPVNYAAKSIVELVDLPMPADCPVYHVLHPTRIAWSAVLDTLHAAHLNFKALPRRDWLKALRASDPDQRRNPSRKLLAFYEGKYGAEEETARAGLCTDKTVEASQWLRDAPVVNEGLVAKWVSAWRESGFLPKP
ncbi:L-aminoadipate-semialdehyde dehydrogenase [Boletus edulis BED1]|uniref:L-aminoadipate-semialdehyde dehydrogenase n=1 Tax=Boletus edulis BED1 TaxID=1328754 RepID=A0AAD4BW25_BOLED|nr:L-aminoadipate-semialdehyde dehydrogenase [Boletus edulis BED1]